MPEFRNHATVQRPRSDVRGDVSFEYVALAASIVGVIGSSLGTGAGDGIGAALSACIGAISTVIMAAF